MKLLIKLPDISHQDIAECIVFQKSTYKHTQEAVSVTVTAVDWLCLNLINFNWYGRPIGESVTKLQKKHFSSDSLLLINCMDFNSVSTKDEIYSFMGPCVKSHLCRTDIKGKGKVVMDCNHMQAMCRFPKWK